LDRAVIPTEDFLCSGSQLSRGIWGKSGVSDVHRAGGDTHPYGPASARGYPASGYKGSRELGGGPKASKPVCT
jgi:hypothetical protein